MPNQNHFAGTVNDDWLAQHREDALEPGLPIVDPHHHLWVTKSGSYLFADLLADLDCGHDVRATVYAECGSMYRADGPEEWRSLGETEFVTGVAAMSASGLFGRTRACAAMFGNVDMRLGERARPILEAHIAASGHRFRGVRFSTAWDADERVHRVVPEQALLADPRVRRGLACLAPLGLSLDAWVYHPQLPQLAAVADAFPELTIILNHIGAPILGGPYAGRRDEVLASWRAGLSELARRPNVFLKVGAIPIRLPGAARSEASGPPSSETVAGAWQPFVETCVELFGAQRCMFESNFPVQKRWCSYGVVWNAFKRVAAGASADEKRALFAGAAIRAYRLPAALIGG
ncbi:amidohydrolase family protein [Quisquiliibacterium transsilvanicum]|uniref:Putative TIM-barrel fold metal-dependent hydrolase n=1 Tax=Quisquiliibacterium transsilvanicum TaxID=1549638 RepID=A0A7W8M855_9BURK|nr:amidohydrolase family protein [Quisquiliibacterium transsilvanicum]MBB5271676.1 putative TIM-barrel fold metal-dependent hydrolase [Quisquiliibacterium transsilvanicum]